MKTDRNLRRPSPQRGKGRLPPSGRGKGLGATVSVPSANVPVDVAKPESKEPEGIGLLLRQIQELREYVSHYAAARVDGVRCSVQNAARRMVLALLGFIAVGGLIVLGTWFVLSGTAQGLGALFGGKPWLGPLLTGAAVLAGVVAGVQVLSAAQRKRERRKMVDKYESRRASQRVRFKRDVQSRPSGSLAGK